MKSTFLKINGIRHHICTWGNKQKPKLFLLHGWMDMGASFEFLCEYLKNDFYCIAHDWRGFGQSEHSNNPLGYFFYEYIADLHAILNFFSPKDPVRLVGHSMGGNIASLYAGVFPERVDYLLNVDGFGIQDMPPQMGPERLSAWIEADRMVSFKVYPNLKALAERLKQQNSKLTPKQASFLAKHISKKVKSGFQIAADARHKWPNPYLYQLENVYPFWTKIRAKTLNVIAENSSIGEWMGGVNPEQELQTRLSHYPSHCEKIVVKNCGHMVHLEKPKELAKMILDFVKNRH